MVDWLSHANVTDLRLSTPSSAKSRTSHVIPEATAAMARFSASEEDLETVFCFFDFRLIGELPNKITYPIIDFLVSKQAPQSDSLKAWIFKVSLPLSNVKLGWTYCECQHINGGHNCTHFISQEDIYHPKTIWQWEEGF